MFNAISTIARFTFHEALRNRLFALLLVGVVGVFGLTEFIGALAMTEAAAVKAVFVAAGTRLFAVIIIALFVITSLSREFNDKGLELLLSLAVPRAAYYLGKLAGSFLLALLFTLVAALLLLLYAELSAVFLWAVSLLCELILIIAFSLLCLFTFSHITVSFVVVIAFYLLARAMHDIQLISHSPILASQSYSQQFISFMIDKLALLLPDLHAFTQSEWLLRAVDWMAIVPVLLQTGIYLAVLASAGLFDLYRKNL